jgi:hypothetical protein
MSISAWGSTGNTAYALPMKQAEPDSPSTEGYLLCWNFTTLQLEYVPVSVDPITGAVTPAGDINLPVNKVLTVGGNQVVGARNTGWAPDTGTPLKIAFDTATVTLPQLAGQVMALKAALVAHGLIGV